MASPATPRPLSTLAAVALTTAVLLGGCTKSDPEAATTTVDKPAVTSSTASGPDVVVESLVNAQADLLDGERSDSMVGGSLTTGSVTLDFCGFDFTTEADRIARRQEVISTRAESYVGSNEAVFYRPGKAELSMAELRDAIAECPKGQPVPSTVEGVPDAAYDITPIAEGELSGLTEDHVAVNVVATPTDGEVAERTLVYQRRGDVLVGTYGDDQERVLDLAEAISGRLAALPGADLGS